MTITSTCVIRAIRLLVHNLLRICYQFQQQNFSNQRCFLTNGDYKLYCKDQLGYQNFGHSEAKIQQTIWQEALRFFKSLMSSDTAH